MGELLYFSAGMFLLLCFLLVVWWVFSHTYHPPSHPHPGVLQCGARLLLIRAATDPACYFLAASSSCPFSGLRKSLAAPISSPSLLESVVKNVPDPTKFRPPAEAVIRIWLRNGLGAISYSWVSAENQCSRPTKGCCRLKSRVSIWTPHHNCIIQKKYSKRDLQRRHNLAWKRRKCAYTSSKAALYNNA